MIHYQEIGCPNCGCNRLRKNGRNRNGTQRWTCFNENSSTATFQLPNTYNAHKRGIKQARDSQTLNSRGVRDIARNLGIKKNTVCAHLKKTQLQN